MIVYKGTGRRVKNSNGCSFLPFECELTKHFALFAGIYLFYLCAFSDVLGYILFLPGKVQVRSATHFQRHAKISV